MKSTFLSIALVGVLGSTSLSVRAAAPAVMHVLVVQPADVPAFVHEIEVLRALYQTHGLGVTIEAYQVAYAGSVVDAVVVQMVVANLAALAKMEEMTRTQPDIAAERKKIDDGTRKLIFEGIFNKLTP